MPPMANPTAPSFRKRQFRFSVRNDIDLLKLVLQHNPYGAPHGGRLHKWQNIANTLRESGIDIDFRRARDRTALLLDQWRQKDMDTLRRSTSANHEDHAQKFGLLQEINDIELAAKPRDIGFGRGGINRRPIVSQPTLTPVHIPDDHVNSNIPHHDRKFPPYPAQTQSLPHSHTGHLPPLNPDAAVIQTRPPEDVPFVVPPQPSKFLRSNTGKRLAAAPSFSQNIFPHSSLPASSGEHRGRSQDISYPDIGGVFRSSPFRVGPGPSTINPIDASTANAMGSLPMPASPRTQDTPIALDPSVVVTSAAGSVPTTVAPLTHPPGGSMERYVPMADFRMHMQRIETILDQHLKQIMERDEKRREEEKERMDRFFEMINQDREDRRIRDERDREERQKIMSFLLRHHGNEPEHNNG